MQVLYMIDLFKLNTTELKALVEYKDILEKNRNFPKDTWKTEQKQSKGIKIKSRILTRYCLENLAKLQVTDLSGYNLKEIKSILVNYKLSGMVQIVFGHDILALLKNAYPQEFKDKVLKDWMWSRHGIWNDDKTVVEAVQDMVRKEGIRRIEDITSLDWKKRLLKHGIYNILARFNWSIYSLFDFVYPGRFHPTDFKYKVKWAAAESLDNAFYYMHNTFKKNRFSMDQILMLGTSDFRKLALAGMLLSLFDSSTLKAKEYYLYKTIGNEEHQKELLNDIRSLLDKRYDRRIAERLKSAASGSFIYNLRNNITLYNFIKRHAKQKNLSISDFISNYGFIYKTAKKDVKEIDKDEVYNLRKQGLTYVEIAARLGSNPTTITKLCMRYFGGDPLIPRPLEDYSTVQELMQKYHVDHKTIMKLVLENGFENHTTIRFRYLKKSEIEPALSHYTAESKQHRFMIQRYAN